MKKSILFFLLSLTLSFSFLTACNKVSEGSSTPESSFSESSSENDSSKEEEDGSEDGGTEDGGTEDGGTEENGSVEELIDFVVEVESGREPVVLQLSDPQLCYWGDLETYSYGYIRDVVEETNPDLILVTGDIVYGKFDETGSLLLSYIEFMESLEIPWAPVFGNHDNECIMGVDWQCAQFETAEDCLFKQGDVTGNGNYSVGIKQNEEILRVFYMLDSNGCSSPMIDRNDNPTTPAAGTNTVKTTAGFGQDQIDWYTEEINAIHAIDADVKISFAYHIQQAIFGKAFEKYDEYDSTLASGSSSALKNPLNLDTLETSDETDFGYLGRRMKGAWDTDYSVWNGMKALGVDSIFVGHEHCNSASIVYEGVRFQYGQKSSTYDRYNWVFEDGTIQGDYKEQMPSNAHALMGGTVIPISSQDGTIGTGYICYSGDPFNFENVSETPSNPAVVQGDSRGTMPTYGGDVTALGFAADTTVYTMDNVTPDNAYTDGWNKRAILAAPATQDYVTFEFVTESDITSGVFHAWGANGSPSLTHIWCNTTDKAIITDMEGNSVSSITAGTHYLLHVACEGLSEVQIGFISTNNTVYFANISFNNGTLGQIPEVEDIVVNGVALTDPQA
ncbi:MAG: metallophosphoesterase, partial [Clostridia bacterium]|nr:metallophosphoesterase [Clostridia bacterium]